MVSVKIFGVDALGCNPALSWRSAASLMNRRLVGRYGSDISVEYIELYTPDAFHYEGISALLLEGAQPPFVMIDNTIVQQGGKLSESRIAKEIQQRLHDASKDAETEKRGIQQ